MELRTWWRKPQTNGKTGHIYAYIVVDGVRSKDFATGIKSTRARFDSGGFEKQIAEVRAELMALQVFLLGELGRVPTPNEIVNRFTSSRKPTAKPSGPTVADLVAAKIARNTGNTRTTYQALIRSLERDFAEFMATPAANVGRDLCAKFITEHSARHKPAHTHLVCAMLSHAFNLALKKNIVKQNPFWGLELPNIQTNITALSPEQIQVLRQNRNQFIDLFLFQIETGLSYIDTQSFDSQNIKTVNGQKYFEGRRKKTGKQYFGRLSELAAEILATYGGRAPVLRYERYRKQLRNSLAALGISGFTSHKARHTLARRIIEKTGRLDVVSACLGSDKKTVEKHYGKQTLQGFAELLEKSGL